jgi:hypothetical protein
MDVLVVVPDRTQHVGDVMVIEPIEGASSGAAHRNEPSLPEQAQLMRRRARRKTRRLDELLDGALAVQHRPEQPKPATGAERSHRLGERIGLFDG